MGSWMKYRPNVSTVNATPSLRTPVRSHWSPVTASKASARRLPAMTISVATTAASWSL